MKTLTVSSPRQLTTNFAALAALEDGWCEGRGLAPDKIQLALIAEKFAEFAPEGLALPFLCATPEGNLLLEWGVPGSPSVDVELASLRAEFHAFASDGSDIERDFLLSTDENWHAFFAFLVENIGLGAQ